VGVGDAQVEHLVEPSRPQQRRVEEVRPVGRADDEDAAAVAVPARHAVELRQQLGHDPVHDAAAVPLVASLGGHRVQLVEEDDAGPSVAGALEDAAHVGLGLADVHVEELGALDAEEVEAVLGGDGLGE
jgi:hypothetical protein